MHAQSAMGLFTDSRFLGIHTLLQHELPGALGGVVVVLHCGPHLIAIQLLLLLLT